VAARSGGGEAAQAPPAAEVKISVVYSERALADVERLADFAEGLGLDGDGLAQTLIQAIETLGSSPFIGRPVRARVRELIISAGKTGYVALYRVAREVAPRAVRIEVLALRHQRESGYG
jgi:plasmid stabilization system protein ParE